MRKTACSHRRILSAQAAATHSPLTKAAQLLWAGAPEAKDA